MKTLILGCMLFGKGQGTKHDVVISGIDEVKIFKTKEEAQTAINKFNKEFKKNKPKHLEGKIYLTITIIVVILTAISLLALIELLTSKI